MNRSTGVTVAAIVLLLGSALGLFVTILDVTVVLWASSKASPDVFPRPLLVLVVAGCAFIACVEIFGIITSIGLLRLKNWARITTIVFAVCIVLQTLLGGLIILVMPLPANPDVPAHFNVAFKASTLGFCLFFVAIGVWWLVLFTRRSVREQFQRATPVPAGEIAAPAAIPPPAPRLGRVPVAAVVVAILLLASTPGALLVPFLHFPAFVLGKVFYGSAADMFYFGYSAIELILGVGLLRLQRWSLPATVAFYVFRMFTASLMFFPAIRYTYLTAIMHALPLALSLPQVPFPFSPKQFGYIADIGGVWGILFCLVLIVFLLRARPAFEQAIRERAVAAA